MSFFSKNQKYSFINCDLPFSDNQKDGTTFSYAKRFVCFFDVLGCTSMVMNSTKDGNAYNGVKLLAELFRETEKLYETRHWQSAFVFPVTHQGYTRDYHISEETIKVNLSLFSDSIIISYEPLQSDLFTDWYRQMHQIFNDICRLQYDFAVRGIFLRGGLSYGLIYHEGNICFGPALVKAVELEKKAVNPIVSVDRVIIDKIMSDWKSDMVHDYAPGYKVPNTLKEFANDLYLSYFDRYDTNYHSLDENSLFMLDWLTSRFLQSSKNIDPIRSSIEKELQKEYPQHVMEKYIWMKNYYNRSIYFEDGHSDKEL